jgi:CheY-like chemotaxis protein
MLGRAQSVVAFEVADTGTGIPVEKQKIVFEAFQQADASTSRKYGGTGLGLAISRELSNLLGGELVLRSEPGVGSVFTLYLPLRYVGPLARQEAQTRTISFVSRDKRSLAKTPVERAAPGPARAAIEVDRRLAGKKVLLVDDDVRNIFALSSFLEDCGMSVLTARTGQEAIDLLHAHEDVAIVLMDVMMPEMDGYETMACIRNDSALSRLPILAITAKAMKGDREKCLEAGASDYLAKPIDTEQLMIALRSWLQPRERQP